ncbi:MAG: hypothetical protein ACPGRZ_02820 [Alphaproteobacteria bacterium]
MLFGSILIFDLRLMGVGRSVSLDALSRLVLPVASAGLTCAVVSGALLFIGRAATYASLDLFRIKMALVAGALVFLLIAHRRYGLRLDRATARQRFRLGVVSVSLWFSVLVSGRMIAFVYG